MNYEQKAQNLETEIAFRKKEVRRKRVQAEVYSKQESLKLQMAAFSLTRSADRWEKDIEKLEAELAEIYKLLEWEGCNV